MNKQSKRSVAMHKRHALTHVRQAGVALIFALLALVALTFGAVALIRAVDTNVLALGNLAFKQSGLTAGGRAAEQAMTWLAANIQNGGLDNDLPGNGYYASSMNTLDIAARSADSANVQALVDWDDNGCRVNGRDVGEPTCVQASPAMQVGEESVRYVITRMCVAAGPIVMDDGSCARPPIPDLISGSDRGGGGESYGQQLSSDQAPAPFFRVITRSLGAKGTVTFTETMVHF
ncbi:hypothetical protein [Paucibacter sp. Y2R2-4]|uniref:pilus assembly PilX family protein n=1 Tax=Paucibacter sp. Y2R2-4 TaxID=2893553 RepID=UPI0021E44A43|nr:hypothetical protein [Paucibacter sp. Y2R2-4]MCV2350016.1 hypothetical protein [Paucibacter sp. Y2R2-4]